MTEHESVRAILALAAAGTLGPEEQRRVEQHARECELCRRDLETWSVYTQGLRKLPQPSAPEGLVQRTQARILEKRLEAAGRRRQELFLGALAIFGWASGWSFWTLARAVTGDSLSVLTWTLLSTALAGVTSVAAALMLSRRNEARRFL